MTVLGVESSCDECSVAVVEDGRTILGQVIATQLEEHAPYRGVVPEIASRTHTRWIGPVYHQALERAGVTPKDLDAVAVTTRPGLVGSLVVGLSFAKGLAYGLGLPLVGVDHMLAHLYAPQLAGAVEYPFLGLLVSGGHTIIARAEDPFTMQVMGTTIDDACGEAFDKVAKHYELGYPGGVAIDRLAQRGDAHAFRFPDSNLHKGEHRYDVSYSGLKTAVINQLDQFWNGESERSMENVAASFQRAAIDALVKRLFRAVDDTGLTRVVVGGGVAANSYLRSVLQAHDDLDVRFPPLELCTDNGAMIAGLGYHLVSRGDRDGLDLDVSSRVPGFRATYP
ncbi:MAG: tRNA (adenosine(37)-N6)-threonylcarbamoyltransferase complex transferase subunit TsaD [Spirochaetota bacterium]